MVKNAKFSWYYFYMKTNIHGDFQICISVPLRNQISQFKIHLFSTLNTKQRNDGIFSNKAGENSNLAKIFLNVRVRL